MARYQGLTSRERARPLLLCSGLRLHLARRDTSPPYQAVEHKSEVVRSTADAGSRCLARIHRTQKNTPARSLMPGFSPFLSSCRFQTESLSSRFVPHYPLPLGPPALPPKPAPPPLRQSARNLKDYRRHKERRHHARLRLLDEPVILTFIA